MGKKLVLHKNSVAAEMLAGAVADDGDGENDVADVVEEKRPGRPIKKGVATISADEFQPKPSEVKRANTISLSVDLWNRIDRAARKNGVSRSRFCSTILQKYV